MPVADRSEIRRRAGAWQVQELAHNPSQPMLRRFTMRCSPHATPAEIFEHAKIPDLGDALPCDRSLRCLRRTLTFPGPSVADVSCWYGPSDRWGDD